MTIDLSGVPEYLINEARQQLQQDPIYFEKFQDFDYDKWRPVQQRRDFVKKYAKGESCLDVACGCYPVTAGLTIKRKVGIDVSVRAAAMAKLDIDEFHFLDMTQTDAETLKRRVGSFDTIVASEFLEHLTSPYSVIEKMALLLNPKGRLLVTVPNGSSIASRVDKLFNHGKYLRFEKFHKTHVSLLKKKEWLSLFEQAGLELEVFDFRPSDIVEGFPKETAFGWKPICSLYPDLLAHQFFYVMRKE